MKIANEDTDSQSVDPGEIYQSSEDDLGIIYLKHGEDFKIYDNPESEIEPSDSEEAEEIQQQK